MVAAPKLIEIAGATATEATSEAESLEEFVSPETLTEALLVTLDGAAGST